MRLRSTRCCKQARGTTPSSGADQGCVDVMPCEWRAMQTMPGVRGCSAAMPDVGACLRLSPYRLNEPLQGPRGAHTPSLSWFLIVGEFGACPQRRKIVMEGGKFVDKDRKIVCFLGARSMSAMSVLSVMAVNGRLVHLRTPFVT